MPSCKIQHRRLPNVFTIFFIVLILFYFLSYGVGEEASIVDAFWKHGFRFVRIKPSMTVS